MAENSNLSILIIDDDAFDRNALKRCLNQSKTTFSAIESETIAEGLSQIEKHDFDCVFVDYNMPGIDGLQGITKIRMEQPFLPLIMLTGQGNEVVATDALRYGASNYLTKEMIDHDVVVNVIHTAIKRCNLEKRLEDQRSELKSFAATLAHDLRAPIRHVTGFIDFIEDDIAEKKYENLADHFSYVKQATSKMNAMIDTLYEYTKVDGKTHFEQVNLQTVMDELLAILEPEIKSNNATVTYKPMPKVYGDAVLLSQLFQNLVMNALKYNDNSTPKINISCKMQDDKWAICVCDNGIGIEPRYFDAIFEPFKRLQTTRNYEGTGLGLTTCKKIVNRHHGDIWCDANDGGGTKICFTLLPKG